jgi:hypothetical protein
MLGGGYICELPFNVMEGELRTITCSMLTPKSIMPRGTTIRVSHNEKNRLDEAAYQMTGTTEIPYGEVLSLLMENAPEVDV